jgi:Ser/Thr protein kinase RdoA (MazF antagonist)
MAKRPALLSKFARFRMLPVSLLSSLASPFGLRVEDLVFIRRSQNVVFRTRRANGPDCILRISTGRYRTSAETLTELPWIRSLIRRDLTTCAPVPTTNGELCVELDPDGARNIAVCFEWAPGRSVTPRSPDQGSFSPCYQALGSLLADLHRHSVPWGKGASSDWPRKHWHESQLLREDFDSLGIS